jgi:3-oxosteroid 1-dehydrogenase
MSSGNGKSESDVFVSKATEGTEFAHQADVVVVGSGAAGHTAALTAHRDGATVLMLEKAAAVGGTTKKSGGWYWIPNNRWMQEAGIADERDDVLRYIARVNRPELYNPDDAHLGMPAWEYELIERFVDVSPTAAQALEDMGAIKPVHASAFPDYFSILPENKAPTGRVLIPEAHDGGLGVGKDMVEQMNAAREREGIELLTEHRVTGVLVNDAGAAVGVVAEHEGRPVAIRAFQAVVFATGGFAQNLPLRRELTAGPTFGSCAAQSNTGDFIPIATALGAPLRGMNYPWLSPLPLEPGLRNRADLETLFQPPGDSMIEVNRFGVRVASEKLQYNEKTQVYWEWDPRNSEYPNLVLFMIWDQECQDRYAGEAIVNPIRRPGDDDAHVIHGETLAELVEAIEERLAGLTAATGGLELAPDFEARLAETIERFNGFARAGVDDDFGRGETPIEVFFNSFHGETEARNPDSPTMYPIADQGPYYATILAPGVLDTKGGPQIDVEARVLGVDGSPIQGIYGAGNCVASPSGKSYWAGGATLGPAITFGYLAGSNAAREAVHELAEEASAKTGV